MIEAANMEAAAAAAGEEGKGSSAALPRAAQATMCVLSLLFVPAAEFVLPCDGRGSGGGGGKEAEECLTAAVWRLSPLICGYLFLWTVAVSRKTATLAVSLRVCFFLLLADAAGSLVSPDAGEVAMFLGTIYSTAVLGYAVPERTDRSAAAAAEATPVYESQKERDRRESSRKCMFFLLVFGTVVLAVIFISTEWLGPHDAPPAKGSSPVPSAALFNTVLFSGPYLLCWTFFVTGMVLRGGFIADEIMWTVVACFGFWYFLGPFLIALLFRRFVVTLLVYWLTGMAMAGFLGYTLAVNEH